MSEQTSREQTSAGTVLAGGLTVPAGGPTLLTGGSGRLGQELRTLLPGLLSPTSSELDLTDPESVTRYVTQAKPALVVHAAAYTNVGGAETEREACWRVNVEGTRNLVAGARTVGARFLHVSTDYVFYGDRGGYREDDTPGPVRNYYSLTKLVAEEAARAYEESLVVRTSFRPREWAYPQAFDDLYTSQDYVDIIAPLIAEVVQRFAAGDVPYRTLHVATERKSVFELARRRAPNVERASKSRAGVALPDDVSLDVSRWQALRERWQAAAGSGA